MPSFFEFQQKRQMDRDAAAKANESLKYGKPQGQRPQATSNFSQQPEMLKQYPGQTTPSYQDKAAVVPQGGSSVNSSGNVQAGGPPPLWYTQLMAQRQSQQAQVLQGPQPTTPRPGPNFVPSKSGGWVTNDHPDAAPQTGGPGQTVGGPNFPMAPQTQFTQWQGPNQQEFDQGGNDLLAYLLQNPQSMSDNNVAQLKEIQKESATSMNRQANQQIEDQAAALGRSGSGYFQGQQNQNNSAMQEALLKSYRDIDLAKMRQDRADELGVLGASGNWLNNQFGRASDSYTNTLRGQGIQDEGDQRDFEFLMGLNENQLNRDFEGGQNALTRALQRELGLGGLGLDQSRLAWDKEQFGQTFPLQRLQVLGNLGLGRGQLDLANRQFSSDDDFRRTDSALKWLLGGL